MDRKIRVGVLGAGRGEALLSGAMAVGMEVVAICDAYEPLLQALAAKIRRRAPGVTLYSDYRKMLEHDLDAVLLANYATEHCGTAIAALQAGKHVLSECMAVFTMAEAVQLVEAVEASRKHYMLAENYPFTANNLEMRRLRQAGVIGEVLYAEGEYIHPIPPNEYVGLASGPGHWRTWLPVTYYCTHSMGPVMLITGQRPTAVSGFVVPRRDDDPYAAEDITCSDDTSVLMCTLENGAVAKIVPWSRMRDHGYRVRVCGNRGTLEHNQSEGRLRLSLETPTDRYPRNSWFTPDFPPELADAQHHGHGGGDFATSYYFAQAIREDVPPIIDVYKALDMTVVGILGYRSALNGNARLEVPDFRRLDVRERYRNDDWNPDPARRRPGMPYPSVRGEVPPPPEAWELHRRRREEYEAKLRETR